MFVNAPTLVAGARILRNEAEGDRDASSRDPPTLDTLPGPDPQVVEHAAAEETDAESSGPFAADPALADQGAETDAPDDTAAEETKFCEECSTVNDKDARFCKQCGLPLG